MVGVIVGVTDVVGVFVGVLLGVKDIVGVGVLVEIGVTEGVCLLYTSPSPRDRQKSRMPSSA